MAEDIRTLKMYMEPLNLYSGTSFMAEDGTGQLIPANGVFALNADSRIETANMNAWVWDSLLMNPPTAVGSPATPVNLMPGTVIFSAHNEQRIDLTGFLQTASALVPMGSASQRASVPQLPGRWDTRSAQSGLTYLRDYTIWSVERLTKSDIVGLQSGGIVRQAITPNMPSGPGLGGGSMTTTQMMSSQTRYYTGDTSISGIVGWLREIFHQEGGMGETAATPHVYCTRVIAGQFSTPSQDETIAVVGNPGTVNNWAANKFWISIPGSWEILNVGVIEPDELEYMTYMQRSVLAPGGRNP